MMQVFKFGGASIKNAVAIRQIAEIVKLHLSGKLFIVVSAMGKTTNKLEDLYEKAFHRQDFSTVFHEIRNEHHVILHSLFPEPDQLIFKKVEGIFDTINRQIHQIQAKSPDYDEGYDQVIPYGEILSTTIISDFLNDNGIKNQWLDAREVIKTDSNFRAATVDWEKTKEMVRMNVTFHPADVIITQGFIGSDANGHNTTLGREGSDYSGAIFANLLHAQSMTIWKDVPGILNADPNLYEGKTEKIDELNYEEAIELSYFGAKIIHPKTIKPLQNKGIPLFVRSFSDIHAAGTIIHKDFAGESLPRFMIIKKNQAVIKLSSKEFNFIQESHISLVYQVLADNNLKVNIIQVFALSIHLSVENDMMRINSALKELAVHFEAEVVEHLDFLTIRNFSRQDIAEMTQNNKVLLFEIGMRNAHFILMP